MRMRRDQAGNDGLAAVVNYLRRTLGNRSVRGWSNRSDTPVTDDDCGVIERSPASSIDDAGSPEDGSLSIRGGCADQYAQQGKARCNFHGLSFRSSDGLPWGLRHSIRQLYELPRLTRSPRRRGQAAMAALRGRALSRS